jgi:undecaprenyl-diphosphatase
MTFFQALLLGLIQGITEFFPVSSSAHLRIFKNLLGISDGEHLLYFDLLCHAGTLVALLFFLRHDLLDLLKAPKKMALMFLALLPLVPAYFLLKPLRLALSDPAYLGYCLMTTSLILFLATRKETVSEQKNRHVLCIGVAQTLALIPGISRSGSTMAMARFCGWEWKDAAKFSFLLAIPAILGGELLETVKLFRGQSEAIGAIPGSCYAAGFAMSLVVGLISVRFAFSLYEKGIVRPFAWYCMAAGIGVWLLW